jgi:hypothetical protein
MYTRCCCCCWDPIRSIWFAGSGLSID